MDLNQLNRSNEQSIDGFKQQFDARQITMNDERKSLSRRVKRWRERGREVGIEMGVKWEYCGNVPSIKVI